MEDVLDGKRGITGDEEEWEGNGKRKHRLSKSRRSANEEDDGRDGSGRRKSLGDRMESRRMSSGLARGDTDEADYDAKKDSGSKLARKKQEVSSLEKLSNWYQDGDSENRHDGKDKSGTRSYTRNEDTERNTFRKTTSKFSDYDGSHRSSRSRDERARDGEDERQVDRDSYHSERRETSREKSHSLTEEVKNRRRWDETDASTKADGSSMGKSEQRGGLGSESKHESAHERSTSSRLDPGETRERMLESSNEKGKSYKEEKRSDSDWSKSRRSDALEEENKVSSITREDRISREKHDRHKELKSSGREAVDNRDRLSNLDEDVDSWIRDKNARDAGYSHHSRSPEKSGRHRQELENPSGEYERGSSLKRKEMEKDNSRDDRAKARENSWSDRSRDREGSRESWKRRQLPVNDRDLDLVHDRELPRRVRDRMDNDRGLGRAGNRKEGRSEAVKASSNFGISTENYDVIEIQPKPLDYGRDDPGSSFARRTEAVPIHDPKSNLHDEWGRSQDDSHRADGIEATVDDSSVKFVDEASSGQDKHAWRDDADGSRVGRLRGQQNSLSVRPSSGQISAGGPQHPNSNQENYGRMNQQGPKGSRPGRGGRIRPPGRDNQQHNVPMPLMGSPFGHLGMPPPGPMQSMNHGLAPGPGPPVPPGVFVSPFSPPVWSGGRGMDVSMLPVSPGVSTLPPGPPGQRFPPNMGAPPNPGLFFNQSGQGRGMPSNVSGPGFNTIVPVGRGNSNEKNPGGWIPTKSGGPPGKAPSRGEQNDYSQNFVDTGLRPQNFIRELELTNVEDYPKLRELIQKKDEIVANASTPPMYYKCDLREFVLSPDFFGTKFDVILVDPPWEEYVHRAPGVTDHMDYWTFEEIMNLKIEAIADTPSFIFLWVGDGVGLEQGRQCLKKWGFRRCEDICWVKTNKNTATPALRHDSHTLFQHSKEHCLMGIKGTVRRSTDGHIIHANIDTDVIIAEEPPYGSTAKPDEMYRIIEHFALGRRRIELFGEDHNIRSGWLTVGKELSSSNFNSEAYTKTFSDKDGKVWQGGSGRNPPPDAPHLVQTTPEIEALRPKSPMKNQQQLQQQQSNSISLTAANSSRRPAGNSPQNSAAFGLNQEASSSNYPGSWALPMDGFKGPNDTGYEMYGFNMHHPMPPNGEFLDFEAQRMMNMM
ncbi:N6-adenosine-methyltransferase non-catalytic subunit MTB [Amaranthus tricolor]|uniref:N6-adenosine-methyltransferase non-catalytic subunit MTB n=1 Tax=Amaranthus tricolor TaxID=29722 RepID=UPI002587DD83|nr:N6-adenosine-methyltransferase non-catalytic subunit MTB [Amaranthus tricolor]